MLLRNRLRLPAVALGLIAMLPSLTAAQDTARGGAQTLIKTQAALGEPIVVVSVASLQRLSKNINYVASSVGQANAGQLFQVFATTYTTGIDRSRPIGIAVFPSEQMPNVVAFVPSTDIKRFLRSLEAQLGPPDELDDGTMVIAVAQALLYIKQVGDWAYISQSDELFEDLPANPMPWLSGMDETYDIGVRVNVQALSPEERELIINQLREGFDGVVENAPEEQADQMREFGGQSIEQLAQVINDTDVLQFGFAIDPTAREIRIETMSTAVEGTELAATYAGQKPVPSKFASVINANAAGFFHASGSIGAQGVEQTKLSLEQATGSVRSALESIDELSDADREELEVFFDRLIEIGVETISEGKTDAGAMLSLDKQELNSVAGLFVSDGSKVVQLAKDVAAKVEENGNSRAPRFTFDAGDYKGVTMHYIEADVPENEEQARQVFGPTLRITIGTGSDAVYLAMGKSSEAMMKKLIDEAAVDTGADRPLSQGQIRLLPILEFAQSVNRDQTVSVIIDTLLQTSGTDTISFSSKSIPRGTEFRLSIGEGILRAVGAGVAVQQAQAAQF